MGSNRVILQSRNSLYIWRPGAAIPTIFPEFAQYLLTDDIGVKQRNPETEEMQRELPKAKKSEQIAVQVRRRWFRQVYSLNREQRLSGKQEDYQDMTHKGEHCGRSINKQGTQDFGDPEGGSDGI
jgi:hypothetical protein